MPRVYSRGACATCKIRRKKCDEAKPLCGACSRLKLVCNYGIKGNEFLRSRHAEPARDMLSPLTVVRGLRSALFTSAAEESVISRIPASSGTYVTPICSVLSRDHRVLWQLMFQDKLVQSALVACFSVVLGSVPDAGNLQRVAYGKALKELRSRIHAQQLTRNETLPVIAAVGALGLMETAAPSSDANLLQHWSALMNLMRSMPSIDVKTLSLMESNVFLMIIELLAYYNTVVMYTADAYAFQRLCREGRVFETLNKLNPVGVNRVEKSPLLSGQYVIYNLILDVTCLHRRSAFEPIETGKLDLMADLIQSLEVSVSADFKRLASEDVLQYYQIFGQIYQMVLASLSICVMTLREPSEVYLESVDETASRNLARFIGMPKTPMCWAAATWPLSILACALRRDDDFCNLRLHISSITGFLDPGHLWRLRALLNKLEQIRQQHALGADQSQSRSDTWPIGLSLLKSGSGILSQQN